VSIPKEEIEGTIQSDRQPETMMDKKKLNKKNKKRKKLKLIGQNWQLYVLILPAFLYFLIFKYFPMYGIQIAFKDFTPAEGILNSDWVGLEHFIRFFESHYFWDLIRNTLGISVYELIVGFPLPIILALALNEAKEGLYKKSVQTITYAPHFISVVVLAGMFIAFLSPSTGIINHFIELLGFEPIAFMEDPKWFKTIFVSSGVWQNTGWGTIIYLAALSGVDPQLHEAAVVDGATRWQRIWYINLPTILPTMVILLIMNVGQIMAMGFEKILLFQNNLNMESSNVIATFVYEAGLLDGQYSFATAVGVFNAIINFILLVAVNYFARKTSETSLW